MSQFHEEKFSSYILTTHIGSNDWQFILLHSGLAEKRIAAGSLLGARASINGVTHFLIFLTPPFPLSLILLKRLMEWRHLLADTPSLLSGWHHLWMDPFRIDDPICWSIYMEKMNLLKTYLGILWGSVNYRFCILKLKPWAKCVSVYRFKYLQYNARTLEVHIGVDY